MKPLVASAKLAKQSLANATDPVLIEALQSVIDKQEVFEPLKYSRKEIPTDEYLEDPTIKLSAGHVTTRSAGVKIKPDLGICCFKTCKELGLKPMDRKVFIHPVDKTIPRDRLSTIDTPMPK